MERWSELLAKPFLVLADVAPGGRVLDVACGTGVLSKAFADAGTHVTGVDASAPSSTGRTRQSHGGRSNHRHQTVSCRLGASL